MTKVRDMIGDYSDPLGDQGVDSDLAISIANEMRTMLETIYRFNCVCGSDEMLAAWRHLNAMERSAWKLCVQARGRNAN